MRHLYSVAILAVVSTVAASSLPPSPADALAASPAPRVHAPAPDALDQAIKRQEMRKLDRRIERSELRDGIVTLTYSDGTVASEPVKRVVQPARVAGAVNTALALKRLEQAAYKAAELKPDAGAEERIAVLEALAEECGKGNLGKMLAAAAAAALAGLAAGRKSKGKG